jgi:PEP-CTERM motif-containing protein
MRLNLTRLLLWTFAAVAVTIAQATLSADTIRLRSAEDDRLANNGNHKKHPDRGRHLGWYMQGTKGTKRTPPPKRRAALEQPDLGGGRLIDREPGVSDASGPLQATPEPGTLALLVTGIGGVAIRTWRGRRRSTPPSR